MSRISDFVAGRTPAELYERYLSPGLFVPWAEELIAMAPPRGAALDIACGTGVVSRALARREEVTGVSAIDVAPPMIALAAKLAADEKLADRISFKEASALDLPFDDDAFDCAWCQQGVQFFPDRAQAMREARRVLKPGGAFVAAVWTAAGDGNPVLGALANSIAKRLGEDLLPLGPASFPDPEALRSVVEEAGFTVRALERREVMTMLPDVETFVLFDVLFLGRPGADGTLQPVLDPDDAASDDVVEALIADMTAELGPYIQHDGALKSPKTANVIIAEA